MRISSAVARRRSVNVSNSSGPRPSGGCRSAHVLTQLFFLGGSIGWAQFNLHGIEGSAENPVFKSKAREVDAIPIPR